MWPVVVVLCWLVLVLSSSPTSTQAGGVPIVAPVGKDPTTSLYTVTIKAGGHALVVDLSGPLHWSRCPPVHRNFPCLSSACQAVNRDIPPGTCTFTSRFINYTDPGCVCPTYPYNPITGECAITDATTFTLSATAWYDAAQQEPVTFMALGACSTELLYDALPAGSWGVSGMSRLTQSLPTQVTSMFKLAKEFALCLPRSGGGSGAVIFGDGGPFQPVADQARRENQVPFLKYSQNGAYYLRVTGINVNNAPVTLPREGALDLDAGSGEGGVILSTVVPYTTLRSDVYRALLAAFDAATSGVPRPGRRAVRAVLPGLRLRLRAPRRRRPAPRQRPDMVRRLGRAGGRPHRVLRFPGDDHNLQGGLGAGGLARRVPVRGPLAALRPGQGNVRLQWTTRRRLP